MKLDGDHVEAGLSVRDNVPLGKDTRAVIKVMTILGSRYLELVPDGPGSIPAKTITLSHTSVPYDLQSLLEDATTTFEQVDSDQFAQSLAVLGKQLGGCRRSFRRPSRTCRRCRRSPPTAEDSSARS